MDVPLKNPRLIETKLEDGVELTWYPNRVREYRDATIGIIFVVLAGVYLLTPFFRAMRLESEDVSEAFFTDRAIVAICGLLMLTMPLWIFTHLVHVLFDVKKRRSVLVRNGIVWFETDASAVIRGVRNPFALIDIARIVVLRVDGRRYPARMVECFDADGKRVLWQNKPVEIIDDLARKLSDLSGVPIEYRKLGERQRRAKR